MGKSFWTTPNVDELRTKSQTFSDLINASATTYGLTSAQAASYQTVNDDFSAKVQLAAAPETRTTVAIINRNNAAKELRAMAIALAKIIDATPTVTEGQRAALGLNVRKTPEPMGAPGTCTNFKVTLHNDGSIETTFKANNPRGMSGVTYQVWRRIGSVGEFSYLFGTGEKKFVDSTIPAGTAQVQYQIRGIRPTSAGAWAQFNVNFGMTAGGAAMASVVETQVEPKMAA
jgi:hypothetical protein